MLTAAHYNTYSSARPAPASADPLLLGVVCRRRGRADGSQNNPFFAAGPQKTQQGSA